MYYVFNNWCVQHQDTASTARLATIFGIRNACIVLAVYMQWVQHVFVISMYCCYRNHLLLMCTLVMVSNHANILCCVVYYHNIGSVNIPRRTHSNVFTGLLAGELMCVLCGYRV